MATQSERRPFASFPLIAKAKRRMWRRRFLVAMLIVVVAGSATGVVLATIANPNEARVRSVVHCTHGGTYGLQCISVRGSGLQVTSLQTSFTGSTEMLKWRIDLERYNCDPTRLMKSECPVVATWHGNAQTRQPTDPRDYVSFAQTREHAYWPTFYSLPHSFGSNLWLCTELAFFNSSTGKWVYNAAGLPDGLRACARVWV